MNDKVHFGGQSNNDSRNNSPGDRFPQPTISPSQISTSTSNDSHDTNLTAFVHPPTPDMGGVGDSRRNGSTGILRNDRKESRNHTALGNEGQGSDFSSASASDDLELDQLSSDDEVSDDEETGLTKNHLGSRRRKRRKHHEADDSVLETANINMEKRISADKSVLKALIVNVSLIAAWYAFSLSISIVRPPLLFFYPRCN